MSSIEDHRTFYANLVVRSAGSSDERLIAAFATVEREHFLGHGPWSAFVGSGYTSTVSDDPRVLYQDIVVAIAPERRINNGQPSLHARCIAACAPVAGESVVQVGAGSGYYTAILATLVGPTGRVTAYEVEPDLAARARDALRSLPQATCIEASATQGALPRADVVYVNAGATHPVSAWLDALKIGGRLVFPLTPNEGVGVMMLVTRRSDDRYAASVLIPVAFIPCVGARDEGNSQAVAASVRSRAIMATKSLVRFAPPDATATCSGDGWWLSSAEAV
jgi:protein-L-isoaspartate(D-aspartate) O-methyltransferase